MWAKFMAVPAAPRRSLRGLPLAQTRSWPLPAAGCGISHHSPVIDLEIIDSGLRSPFKGLIRRLQEFVLTATITLWIVIWCHVWAAKRDFIYTTSEFDALLSDVWEC